MATIVVVKSHLMGYFYILVIFDLFYMMFKLNKVLVSTFL